MVKLLKLLNRGAHADPETHHARDDRGVSGARYPTISLALNNRSGIPETPRELLKKIAGEMGYRPDPLLSALATYRSDKRRVGSHGAIGWVDFRSRPRAPANDPGRRGWARATGGAGMEAG